MKKLSSADLIIAVFDNSIPLDDDDKSLIRACKNASAKKIACINKSDCEGVLDRQEVFNNFDNVVEISAAKGEGTDKLQKVLYDLFEEFGYYLEGVHNIGLAGIEGSKRIEKIMRYFQSADLTNLAGKHIKTFEDYDKLIKTENGKESKLTLPQSFVLKYIFDDGGWFVLRPSGTEPKLKIYIAIKGKTEEESRALIATLKQEILNIIDRI